MNAFPSSSKCLSPATIRVAILVQNIVTPPIHLVNEDFHNTSAKANPKYQTSTFCKLVRRIMILQALFFQQFGSARTYWLISQSPAGLTEALSLEKLAPIVFCVLIACLTTIGLYGYVALYVNRDLLAYIITQRFKLIPAYPENLKVTKTTTLGDVIVIFSTATMLGFPLYIVLSPLFINYDILQTILLYFAPSLEQLENKYIYKIPIGLIYGILTAYFAALLTYLFGLLVLLLEGLQNLSYQLCEWTNCPNKREFSEKLEKYRIIQIVLTLGNNIAETPLLYLVISGVILTSSCTFTAVKLYRDLPLLVVIALLVMVMVVFIVDFGLVILADFPYRQTTNFKLLWKKNVQIRYQMERKQIKSCPVRGYNIGPMRDVRRFTALLIANQCVDNAVNLLLLS